MNRDYRCYFLGSDGKFKDFVAFVCADDQAAIAQAQRYFASQSDYVGFELWESTRKVYLRPPPPASTT
ncbi:MAG TPA: hypothetical protein VNF99_11310 [Stellaceae bacterium]|nr:hypothetical protein [Stellaceae bacterium]